MCPHSQEASAGQLPDKGRLTTQQRFADNTQQPRRDTCVCHSDHTAPSSRPTFDSADAHQQHATRSLAEAQPKPHSNMRLCQKSRADSADAGHLATQSADRCATHSPSLLPSRNGNWLRQWLPFCVVVLRILIFDSRMLQVGGKQPILGASLSWAVDNGFRRGAHEDDRTVTFTLHSAVRMSISCNYTLMQKVKCSTSQIEQECSASNNTCSRGGDVEAPYLRAVMAEHGVLCVGQVMRMPNGVLELVYTPSEAHSDQMLETCVSDASDAVKRRLTDGTVSVVPSIPMQRSAAVGREGSRDASLDAPYVARSRLGKVNDFLVTSLHNKHDPLSAERRVQGMNVAMGVLVHTVHVDKRAVGLIAWLSTADGAGAGGGILLPNCVATESPDPCSTNVNLSAARGPSFVANSEYWDGMLRAQGTSRDECHAAVPRRSPATCNVQRLCAHTCTLCKHLHTQMIERTRTNASALRQSYFGHANPGNPPGLSIAQVPPEALVKTFVPLCCSDPHCLGPGGFRVSGFGFRVSFLCSTTHPSYFAQMCPLQIVILCLVTKADQKCGI